MFVNVPVAVYVTPLLGSLFDVAACGVMVAPAVKMVIVLSSLSDFANSANFASRCATSVIAFRASTVFWALALASAQAGSSGGRLAWFEGS